MLNNPCPDSYKANYSRSSYGHLPGTIGLGIEGEFFQEKIATISNFFTLTIPKEGAGGSASLGFEYCGGNGASWNVSGDDLVSKNW